MRSHRAVLLVFVLLILAMAPWVVSSCWQQPLLPDELRQQRERYEETVAAAQTATRGAERMATSEVAVVPLGTVAADEAVTTTPTVVASTPTPPTPSPSGAPSGEAQLMETTVPAEPTTTPSEEASSVVTVSTVVATQTPQATRKVIIVRSSSTPPSPEPSPSASSSAYASPVVPQRLVETEDVITQEMLTAQVKADANDATISDLQIYLIPDGVHAVGNISIFPGIKRPIETRGTFAVENDSLVVNVTSILFDSRDVTQLYRTQLEDSINWSLYQLLPQRYVKSYELSDGQVVVRSEVRP